MQKGDNKTCLVCERPFYTQPSLARVKTCSIKCGSLSKRGQRRTEEQKAKLRGRPAWNKGVTGYSTSKKGRTYAYQPRPNAKGRIAWNKGKPAPWVTGENAYQWRTDRTEIQLNKDRHWTKEYRHWRTAVFTRDGFKCKISGKDCCAYVEAHHILSWREYPDLRFIINNGITLCRTHHPRKRVEEKRLSPYFQDLVSVSKV